MTDTTAAPVQTGQYVLGDGQYMTKDQMYDMFGNVGSTKEIFYDWGGLNEWLFLHINSLRGDTYDQLMLLISQVAYYKTFHYWLGVIGIFALLSLIFHKFTGQHSTKSRLRMWVGIFIVLLCGFAVNSFVVHTLKEFFEFPRPYVALAKENIQLLEVRTGPDDGHRSFPSGHVAFITFIIMSLWPGLNSPMKKAGLLFIALVAWSRVSLGVHFPADTLGAFLITGLLIILLRKFIYRLLGKIFGLHC